jgi:hypothetical protein
VGLVHVGEPSSYTCSSVAAGRASCARQIGDEKPGKEVWCLLVIVLNQTTSYPRRHYR